MHNAHSAEVRSSLPRHAGGWGSQKNTDQSSRLVHNLVTVIFFLAASNEMSSNSKTKQERDRKFEMKKVFGLSLLLCAGAFAQGDTVVHWRGMEGVITAPGVDNPVSQIHSGAGPWTTRNGSARVNLATGEGSFDVEGLVLNGGNASGTPGPVASVKGTLVCNPGSPQGTAEAAIDTPVTGLSPTGDAELSFTISVPPVCINPVFLIRVASGRWIATGTKPASSSKSGY